MAMPTEPQGADIEILQQVAEETGYNFDDLWKIYGYESSHGTHPDMYEGTFQGPFQFDITAAKQFNLEDRHDLKQSAEAFVRSVDFRRERMYQNIKNTSGDFGFIDSLDPALLDYLLHQQGGKGMARMSLAHGNDYSYYWAMENPKKNVRRKLLANLNQDQQDYLINKTKSPKEAINYYIKETAKELEKRSGYGNK
jgi:hypothetical protein